MRRKDKQVSHERALEILKNGQSGVLSLIDENGMPYCVPLSYVYHAEAIWFHCANEGKKLDCIAANENICFCVFSDHGPIPEHYSVRYDSAVVFGKACIVRFEPMVEEVLYELCKKYTPHADEEIARAIKADLSRVCIVRVSVDEITGKSSGH